MAKPVFCLNWEPLHSGGDEETESETGFVVSPAVGYDFGKLSVAAEYNIGNDDWTWFSIGVAYTFGK